MTRKYVWVGVPIILALALAALWQYIAGPLPQQIRLPRLLFQLSRQMQESRTCPTI